MRNFSRTRAKNAAKIWRKILQIFALEFPGKVAARNFTKNPPHFPRETKHNSFTARFWEGGAPSFCVTEAEDCPCRCRSAERAGKGG